MNEPAQSEGKRLVEAKEQIARFHRVLDKRTHFELLNVTEEEVDAEQLKAAYLALAKKWHADNFAGLDLGTAQKKLDEIFQQISEAYETLSDPVKRQEYIVLLERQRAGMSTDVHSILRAEQLVDEATAEMRRKNWADAKRNLEEAISLNKDDPLYTVHLAWCIWNHKGQRAEAASEVTSMMKAAVKRQEALPLAYLHLGQIAFKLDQPEEAKKWWKKCLEWEPNNIDAQRGIRLINTRAEKKKKQGLGGLFSKLLGKG